VDVSSKVPWSVSAELMTVASTKVGLFCPWRASAGADVRSVSQRRWWRMFHSPHAGGDPRHLLCLKE